MQKQFLFAYKLTITLGYMITLEIFDFCIAVYKRRKYTCSLS